jgi:hypothetical protein
MVLNLVVLIFVIELDRLLYAALAPQRLHTLLSKLEPVPMPPQRRLNAPGLNSLFKVVTLAVCVVVIHFLLVGPAFWRIEQAQNILCSGAVDFVFATNPATGMVHVTKARGTQGWTEYEKVILQSARPDLESTNGWEPYQELLGARQGILGFGQLRLLYGSGDPERHG